MHRPFPLFSLHDVPWFSLDDYGHNVRSVTHNKEGRAYIAFNSAPTILKYPIIPL